MHKYKKILLQYLALPFIIVVVVGGILVMACNPINHLFQDQLRATIIRGTPEFSYNLQEKLFQNSDTDTADTESDMQSEENMKNSEVELPKYGTQYGMLSCKDIDLEVPVYYGDSYELLSKGAGQSINSCFPGQGNYILIGGHDTSYFAPLEQIAVGDEIAFATTYGRYSYKVTKTAVININTDKVIDEAIDKENTGNEQLILYTCYPFGDLWEEREQRLFVYCEKTSGTTIQEVKK